MKSREELHPELSDSQVEQILAEGVQVFNAGKFFDSHEYFEEIWRSTNPEPRDLFQGLVQVAAALYIWLHRGKAEPANRMLGRAMKRLEPLGEESMGVLVRDLLAQLHPWAAWLEKETGESPPLPLIRRATGAMESR